jgi:hypothetical protein
LISTRSKYDWPPEISYGTPCARSARSNGFAW